MSYIKTATTIAFMGAITLGLSTPLPAQSPLISYCQRVNYPVGLIVRSAPRSSSRRVGSIAYRQRVNLDGKLNRTVRNNLRVTPITAQDSEGTTWIKIKSPIRGYILYGTGEDRDSLVSCQQ